VQYVNLANNAASYMLGEPSPYDFNFWQFGHFTVPASLNVRTQLPLPVALQVF
jgi:hypothetical protein